MSKRVQQAKSLPFVDLSWLIFSCLSLVFLGIYTLIRVYYYLGLFSLDLNFFLASLLLLSELFIIWHTAGSLLQMLSLNLKRPTWPEKVPAAGRWPLVTVLIPVRNEPRLILEQTIVTVKAMDYERFKVVLLDGSDKLQQLDNQYLARLYDVDWWTSSQPPKSKSEIINRYLPQLTSPYVAVFDSDQSPMMDFLRRVVAIAEADRQIAFVQTPQFYANTEAGPIAKAASMQQAIFFEGICEAKGLYNAMFCCGTNVLLRTEVLKKVGGFDERYLTEDFATSIDMHAAGYKSVYYDHVRVFGLAPESLGAYFKQQFRWAAGTMGSVGKLARLLITRPFSLTLAQWWEYSLSATYYLTGVAFAVLLFGPVLFLTFGIPIYFLSPKSYLGAFIPFFVMNLSTYYINMHRRNYSWSQMLNGMVMGVVTFPIYLTAFFSVIGRKKLAFEVTPKLHSAALPWYRFWPWLLIIAINLMAIAMAFTKLGQYSIYALGVNIFWCFYHAFLLSLVFRYNKEGVINQDPVYLPLPVHKRKHYVKKISDGINRVNSAAQ